MKSFIKERNMTLCYHIRSLYHDDNLRNQLNTLEERVILDRLMIMCYRCEAKLNLILFQANAVKEDQMVLDIKENEKDILEIDQKVLPTVITGLHIIYLIILGHLLELFNKIRYYNSRFQVDRRQSPDSPPACSRRPHAESDVTLSYNKWHAIKMHCQNANYIMKAHSKWQQAERLLAKQNFRAAHEEFFAQIPRICDVPELRFYESSLKDLSQYQKAVVNKLRDEIQSNPQMS